MATGRLTVRRAGGYLGAARRLPLFVDGDEVGRVWPGRQLSVELPEGSHELTARLAGRSAVSVPVEIASSRPVELVAAVRLADPGAPFAERFQLVLDPPDAPAGRNPTIREVRGALPPAGYRRLSSRETLLLIAAVVVGLVGQLIRRVVPVAVSLTMGGVAAAVIVVMFLRLFLYRDPAKRRDRTGRGK